jgi:hypothetical protein
MAMDGWYGRARWRSGPVRRGDAGWGWDDEFGGDEDSWGSSTQVDAGRREGFSKEHRRTPCHTCPHCTDSHGQPKQAYESEDAAERRAEIILEERGVDLRVYECPYGEGWHLTSRTWYR